MALQPMAPPAHRLGPPAVLEGPEPAAAERLVLRTGLWLTAAATAIQTVVHLVNRLAFDLSSTTLDAGFDGGLFSFASAVATAVCGVFALLMAAGWPHRRTLLLALALILGVLALDDMFAFHERLAGRLDFDVLGVTEIGNVLWPVLLLPVLGACFAGLWIVSRGLTDRVRRHLRAGLGLLASALVLEAVVGTVLRNVGFDRQSLVYELEVTVEEAAELAGWLLIAVALAAAVIRGRPARLR